MGRRWNISAEEARLEGEVLEERLTRADREDAPLFAEQLAESDARTPVSWSAGPFELVLEETGNGAQSAGGLMEMLLVDTGWKVRTYARAAFSGGEPGRLQVVGEDEEVWTFFAASRTELHAYVELGEVRLPGTLDVILEPSGETFRCATVSASAGTSVFLLTLEQLEQLATSGGSIRFSRSDPR